MLRAATRPILVALLLFGVAAGPARASHDPATLSRVSVSTTGEQVDDRTDDVDLSADGRFVVFSSEATNLVPNDTNDTWDVFLHDRMTHETTRVSVTESGEQISLGHGGSLSANGRYVVFYSPSTALVEGDVNGHSDVFRKDLETGEVELVSAPPAGSTTTGSSLVFDGTRPISDNGRYVAFSSNAPEHVPGTPPPASGRHIYVRDMEKGETRLVSRSSDGTAGSQNSQIQTISGNGEVVAFETRSPLDPRDTNGLMDVYAHNHLTGETEWVSTNDAWRSSRDSSWRPDVNYDGTLISFDSTSTNLVPRDQGGITPDVYLRDLANDRTEKISVSSEGLAGNGWSFRSSISSDGRFVSFWSESPNFVPGKTSMIGEVFVRDRLLGITEKVSQAYDGSDGNSTSQSPSLSGHGETIAFESFASNLVPDDTNERNDLFVRDFGPPVGIAGTLGVTSGEDAIRITGRTRATGAQLATDDDPAGDLPPASGNAVGDIIGTSLSYRRGLPQELHIRVRFDSLPQPALGVAAPGPFYGVSFTTPRGRFEIRLNAAEDAITYSTFTLYGCGPVCVPIKDVLGGFGTGGSDIHFGTSLTDVGAAPGDPVTDIRAFAGLGASQTGGIPLDEAVLPDVVLPEVGVHVGIAPAGTETGAVSFQPAAPSADGLFGYEIPTGDLSAGEYDVWVRTCLGVVCGYDSAAFTKVADDADLAETVIALELTPTKEQVVATAHLMALGEPVPGKTITFSLDGVHLGSAVTGSDGGAELVLQRNQIRPSQTLYAFFAGDSTHAGSDASAVMSPRP